MGDHLSGGWVGLAGDVFKHHWVVAEEAMGVCYPGFDTKLQG